MALLSRRAFARAVNVSPTRVRQLVEEGLPSLPDGQIDEAEGRAWMDQHLDAERRQSSKAPGSSTHASRTRNKKLTTEAALLEVRLGRESGALVARASAERVLFVRARGERDAWTGWSARAATAVAAAAGVEIDAVYPTIDRLVREHLAELAAKPMESFDVA